MDVRKQNQVDIKENEQIRSVSRVNVNFYYRVFIFRLFSFYLQAPIYYRVLTQHMKEWIFVCLFCVCDTN